MAALHFQSDNLNSTQRLQPAVNSVEVLIPIASPSNSANADITEAMSFP